MMARTRVRGPQKDGAWARRIRAAGRVDTSRPARARSGTRTGGRVQAAHFSPQRRGAVGDETFKRPLVAGEEPRVEQRIGSGFRRQGPSDGRAPRCRVRARARPRDRSHRKTGGGVTILGTSRSSATPATRSVPRSPPNRDSARYAGRKGLAPQQRIESAPHARRITPDIQLARGRLALVRSSARIIAGTIAGSSPATVWPPHARRCAGREIGAGRADTSVARTLRADRRRRRQGESRAPAAKVGPGPRDAHPLPGDPCRHARTRGRRRLARRQRLRQTLTSAPGAAARGRAQRQGARRAPERERDWPRPARRKPTRGTERHRAKASGSRAETHVPGSAAARTVLGRRSGPRPQRVALITTTRPSPTRAAATTATRGVDRAPHGRPPRRPSRCWRQRLTLTCTRTTWFATGGKRFEPGVAQRGMRQRESAGCGSGGPGRHRVLEREIADHEPGAIAASQRS